MSDNPEDRERAGILTLRWILGKYIERMGGSSVANFLTPGASNHNGRT
jgi:hypothetical protein